VKSTKLRSEAALASLALRTELPTTHAGKLRDVDNVVAAAKRLQRLQTRRSKLRRDLRAVEADIKHARKMLRAFAGLSK
jgi:hypothetical protein